MNFSVRVLSSTIYIFLELKNYHKDLIVNLLQRYEGFKTVLTTHKFFEIMII